MSIMFLVFSAILLLLGLVMEESIPAFLSAILMALYSIYFKIGE